MATTDVKMPAFKSKITKNLYRDDRGRLKLTRSGHYRFDLILSDPDTGDVQMSVMGFRLDYARKRILPVTIPDGKGGAYTVAEVSPEEHANMVRELLQVIDNELEEERIRKMNY